MGHTDWVTSVVFSPDGGTVASGSWDSTVRLWDAVTGEEKATLRGHTGFVNSVSFSSDGSTLASGSWDSTVRLWDAVTGEEKATLRGHTGFVNSVSFSPDGSTVASGSRDSTVRLWDAVTGEEKATLREHTGFVNSVSFSPLTERSTVASGSWDSTVRLWDAVTGEEKATLAGHTGFVKSVSFSPDGSTLASGSSDGTILLWEVIPAPSEPEKIAGDINRDGVVNISDLLFVAKALGRTEPNDADVNGDGAINILDLVLVASTFGNTAAAPLARAQIVSTLTAADVERWLTQAEQVALTDPAYLRGIAVLEQLLSMLTPKETILLPNYPNPFNPETWIPYHLANASDVQISIYDTNGALVRQLDLGHQQAGYYTNRSRARVLGWTQRVR
ncbi:Probable serine/threonine-protein kinase PkwA [Geodia barretti]|uniref:Probable serine/threonine-protein kinase PkwA n=1 Tax=Geodia barretti TaxID=519541 RepID=A0AA35W5F5_GEOBA|nr:Probable serine/threonine-protein kinase PkwA [Geodia barretti]